MTKTAICRECENYVPVDSAVTDRRDEDGTVLCRECGTSDSWSDF